MSAENKVAQLEDLLARIKKNAAEPRTHAAPQVMAAAAAPPAPPTPQPETTRHVSAAPAAEATPQPAGVATTPPGAPSVPPPVAELDFDMAPPAAELEVVEEESMDVEVSSEVVEVDIDVDEAAAIEAAAAHNTSPPMELEVVDDEPMAAVPVTQEEPHIAPANELEEPTPSSSPRPIEEPMEAEESAPRHTPPPESGKQVAASAPPPARESSIPPPSSLGGHTLIGGWREPGLEGSGVPPQILTGGPTPVRVPAPAGAQPPRPAPQAPPPAPVPAASGTRLTPEATKPELPAAAKVATIEGEAPAFKPATFGDLLDATLAL